MAMTTEEIFTQDEARTALLEHTERETIVEAIESLSDFSKDSSEHPHSELRLIMTPVMYSCLVEEVGHEVDVIAGLRINIRENLSQ